MKLFNKKIKAVEKYQNFKSDNDFISFDELTEIPVNKVIQIKPDDEGAMELQRISNTTEDISFRVIMKKGEIWKTHQHDCKETIIVYKGKLKDNSTDKIRDRLQSLIINPKTVHHIEALEDSIFYVEFKNPE